MKSKKIMVISLLVLAMLGTNACKKNDAYLEELKALPKKAGSRAAADKHHQLAFAAHQKGDYAVSEQKWYEAAKADPSWAMMYFNLACSTALQGKKDAAVEYVALGLELDAPLIMKYAKNDRDIAGIRELPRFKELMGRYGDEVDEKNVKNLDERYRKMIIGNWDCEFDPNHPNAYSTYQFNRDGSFKYPSLKNNMIDTYDDKLAWKISNNELEIYEKTKNPDPSSTFKIEQILEKYMRLKANYPFPGEIYHLRKIEEPLIDNLRKKKKWKNEYE